jgi:uncharacterized protein YdhG (YjbR/CyaY superfamily)
MKYTEAKTHEEYIAQFEGEVASRLEKINKALTKALPNATKVISYQMPVFKTSEALIYYGVFSTHISIFPTPSGVEAFKNELADYVTSKGTIQIQHSQALPLKLIVEIANFRDTEVNEKIKALTVRTTCRKGHVYDKSPICKSCPECAVSKSSGSIGK